MLRALLLASCALPLGLEAACASASEASRGVPLERSVSASTSASATSTPAPSEEPRWKGAHEARSDDGRYLVRWRADREPIPEGASFAIDAWVFDAKTPEKLLDDVTFDFDASMPQHGHGMTRVARVSKTGAGAWRAEGLLFHMPGRWQIAFDITRGARTDRVRAEVELE